MYRKKRIVAMLLAGGQGSRLGVLTDQRAKPAVTYGGKYRIIDFPLSNCIHSGIDTVGILTQYQPLELNTYIGAGSPWDLDTMSGGAFVLPPYVKGKSGKWYSGTANAIYQNIYFADQFDPEVLIVLSGDHIYKMNYSWLIRAHIEKGADATIAVIPVPIEEASRFGIMNTDKELRVLDFEEKPEKPKSNLASMGIYAFQWEKIKSYLIADANDPDSSNDFGKNIIPAMLANDEKLYAYEFKGYWKDVGTVRSLWDANMELLQDFPPLNLYDDPWRIFSRNPNEPPHYVDYGAEIKNSIVSEGCYIYGSVINSILSSGVTVEKDAIVQDSIIMAETRVGEGSRVHMSIVDEEADIGKRAKVGEERAANNKITVLGKKCVIRNGAVVEPGKQVGCGVAVLKTARDQVDDRAGGSRKAKDGKARNAKTKETANAAKKPSPASRRAALKGGE
ncbi:MAG: glucose-1-phosphate adenylyltransferase [Clostridiales Family XIII bacterium]|jgi:glucose-1-phosphate adenylyltransferase|nr:glucose-1-phosphate adenylyltransferase [Clostridiales Family XIII bacterium]